MHKPDFTKYSLALFKDSKLIYTSKGTGIRPLVECIMKMKKEKHDIKDCTLHDKVIGLAAARLIIHSDIINSVYAGIISREALEMLEKKYIDVEADKGVEKILSKDKKSPCPMEELARKIPDNKLFFLELEEKIKKTYC
jgi:hypothetical protein